MLGQEVGPLTDGWVGPLASKAGVLEAGRDLPAHCPLTEEVVNDPALYPGPRVRDVGFLEQLTRKAHLLHQCKVVVHPGLPDVCQLTPGSGEVVKVRVLHHVDEGANDRILGHRLGCRADVA